MLRTAEIDCPITLVGHSYGGLCAQHFAKLYTELVSSIVLVDSTSVNLKKLNELPSSTPEDSDASWIELCNHYATLSANELRAKLLPTFTFSSSFLSPDAVQRTHDFLTSPSLYKAMASEVMNWEHCAETIKAAGPLPDIPLVVIGRDPQHSILSAIQSGMMEEEATALEHVWQQLIMDQANLSANSKYVVASGAGHSIHLDRPDIIIQQISRLISSS